MKKRLFQPLQVMFLNSFFFELVLFLFIIFAIVLPSILTTHTFVLPARPSNYQALSLFLFKIFFLAMFEELIYRVYLPFQLKRFFLKQDEFMNMRKSYVFILISNFLFAMAHLYLGLVNVFFAFVMGLFFSFIYAFFKKNAYIAFFVISLIHFIYNTIAFYILIGI